MAAQIGEDYLAGDDLDDLFELIDGGFLEDNVDFNTELDAVVTEVESCKKDEVYRCQNCDKVCISQRGLTRHCTVKHALSEMPDASPFLSVPKLSKEEKILKKLHPLTLKLMVKKSAEICFGDRCLPESARCMFSEDKFKFSTDEAVELWNKIKPLIESFHGDAEDFYSHFYGLLGDNLLPLKFEDVTLSNILLTEVANHILIHLSGTDKVMASLPDTVLAISENELKSLQYIAGFIVHKLHTKFRFSKKCTDYNKQAILILQACKVDCDNSQTLINIRDRGGLWRVNKQIQDVFRECEKIFRSKTSHFSTTLKCHDLVKDMLKNCSILSNFNSVCYTMDPKVSKEVSINLLEHMLTLYTRVRSFSYARDIREKHKAAKKAAKKRSLRTEIKKSSSNTDMGH